MVNAFFICRGLFRCVRGSCFLCVKCCKGCGILTDIVRYLCQRPLVLFLLTSVIAHLIPALYGLVIAGSNWNASCQHPHHVFLLLESLLMFHLFSVFVYMAANFTNTFGWLRYRHLPGSTSSPTRHTASRSSDVNNGDIWTRAKLAILHHSFLLLSCVVSVFAFVWTCIGLAWINSDSPSTCNGYADLNSAAQLLGTLALVFYLVGGLYAVLYAVIKDILEHGVRARSFSLLLCCPDYLSHAAVSRRLAHIKTVAATAQTVMQTATALGSHVLPSKLSPSTTANEDVDLESDTQPLTERYEPQLAVEPRSEHPRSLQVIHIPGHDSVTLTPDISQSFFSVNSALLRASMLAVAPAATSVRAHQKSPNLSLSAATPSSTVLSSTASTTTTATASTAIMIPTQTDAQANIYAAATATEHEVLTSNQTVQGQSLTADLLDLDDVLELDLR
eukprot:GILJ01009836.1.p1 GENE.GILJ01009836.1~~GILJ01009836.1.p1  ORF type:complete len:447 (-),score=42.09 GILJ01009836.1:59-1399(-)